MWFPNSAITDFSPECSSSKLGNGRSAKGGLKGLHGDAGAENEKMFLENTLEFVTGGGGALIMLTSAVCVEDSNVWEKAPVEAKERLFQICHPCVFAKNALCSTEYYLKVCPLLRIAIAMVHNLFLFLLLMMTSAYVRSKYHLCTRCASFQSRQ
jgi:hypothetical protein